MDKNDKLFKIHTDSGKLSTKLGEVKFVIRMEDVMKIPQIQLIYFYILLISVDIKRRQARACPTPPSATNPSKPILPLRGRKSRNHIY